MQDEAAKISDHREGNTSNSRKTRALPTVGLLLDGLVSSYHTQIWSGVADIVSEQGAKLIIFAGKEIRSPVEFEAQANIVYDLVSPEIVDGLMILAGTVGGYISKAEIQDFCQQYYPMPIISIAQNLEGIPSILIDNEQSMRDLMGHLIKEHGYRRLAFINGPKQNTDAQTRYRIYIETLTQYGIPIEDDLIAPGNFTAEGGTAAIELLLDQRKVEFEVVIAADDNTAIGTLRALRARGKHIPDEIAVVGFDDDEVSRHITPPLTTIRQPVYTQGRLAAETLLAQLRGDPISHRTILPSQLILRRSCGCPSPSVIQAAAKITANFSDKDRRNITAVEVLFARTKGKILSQITETISEVNVNDFSKHVEQLLDAFHSEIENLETGIFLRTLEEILRQATRSGGRLMVWQSAISILRRHLLPYLEDKENSRQAEDLWHQARVLIGETAQQAQAYRRLRTEQRTQIIRQVSETISTTLNLAELVDVLAKNLPRLGIKQSYLALYESSEAPTEWSRLILGYNRKKQFKSKSNGHRFRSDQLIPTDWRLTALDFPQVVMPLYFKEQQLGHAVFEIDHEDDKIYEILRGQISSALSGALLMQQRQQAEQELARRATQIEEEARALTMLNEMAADLSATIDIEQVFRIVATKTYRIIRCDRASVTLLNSKSDRITFYALDGLQGAVSLGTEIPLEQTTAEIAINEKRIVNLANLSTTNKPFTRSLLSEGIHSALYAPLISSDRVLGTLNVVSKQPHAFKERDENLVRQIASLLSETIESRRLFKQTKASLTRTEMLYSITRSLIASKDLSELLQLVVNNTAKILAADKISLFTLQPEIQKVTHFVQSGPGTGRLPVPKLDTKFFNELDNGLVGWVLRELKPIFSPKGIPDSREAAYVQQRRIEHEAGSIIVVPLHYRENPIGAMVAINRPDEQDFTQEDLDLMTAITNQAAIVINNRSLFEEIQERAAELEEAKNFLDLIIENVPNGLFVKEASNLNVVRWNKANEEITGLKREEVIGKSDYDFLPKEKAGSLATEDRRILASGKSLEISEYFTETPEGHTRILHLRKIPILSGAGKPKYLLGICEDITEHRRLEQQIQESLERRERQVQTIIEIAQEIAAAPALDTLFYGVVHLVQQRFGYYHAHAYTLEYSPLRESKLSHSNDEGKRNAYLAMQAGTGEVGRTLKVTNHRIALQAEKSLVARAAREGQPILVPDVTHEDDWLPNALLPETKSELAVPIKLGHTVLGVLDVQSDTIEGVNTEDQIILMALCGQIAVAIDYRRTEDERYRAEEALKAYAAELERSNRELEAFAYVASHDLQEPLRKILAFGDRLGQKYQDTLDDRGRDYINRMRSAAARMQTLIGDLLRFSRVTTRAQPFSVVDLNQTIREVISDLETYIEEVQGQLEIEDLPTIEADQTQIRQLFQNLISNALKFHRAGEAPVVKIQGTILENRLCQIIVKDNGIGFEEKYAERIFGVFQRLHNRSEYEGTGVGLAICRKIVERHGGTIIVKSIPDQGSSFIVKLPISH